MMSDMTKSKRGEIQLEVPTQFVNNITFASQLLLAFFGNLSSKNIFQNKNSERVTNIWASFYILVMQQIELKF